MALRLLCEPAVIESFADVSDRVERLVLLTPADAGLEKPIPLFESLSEVRGWEVETARQLGILEPTVYGTVREGVSGASRVPAEEAEKRMEILRDRERRRAMQAMIRGTMPWRRDGGGSLRPDWERVEEVEGWYERVEKPCLIVWGGRDEVFPVSMGYKLATQIPYAELVVFSTSKHSVHIDDPVRCAEVIREFLDRTAGGAAERTQWLNGVTKLRPRYVR